METSSRARVSESVIILAGWMTLGKSLCYSVHRFAHLENGTKNRTKLQGIALNSSLLPRTPYHYFVEGICLTNFNLG